MALAGLRHDADKSERMGGVSRLAVVLSHEHNGAPNKQDNRTTATAEVGTDAISPIGFR